MDLANEMETACHDTNTSTDGNVCLVQGASSNGCTRQPRAIRAPFGGGVWGHLFPDEKQSTQEVNANGLQQPMRQYTPQDSMQRSSVHQDKVHRDNVQQDRGQASLPVYTMMTEGNAIEPRATDDDPTSVTLGPNDVVQHTVGSDWKGERLGDAAGVSPAQTLDGGRVTEPARGSTTEVRVTDDDLTSVTHGSTDVVSQTVGSSMKDEQLRDRAGGPPAQGLGVYCTNNFKSHECCSSGTGLGESHLRGRCAPMSHQVPGLSVIVSTSRRSDEAPPEGRPSRVKHSYVESVDDTKLEEYTARRDCTTADLDASGGSGAGMDAHVKVINKCRGIASR